MKESAKLMLTVTGGGLLLGGVLGTMAHPAMKFAEEPDWRARFQAGYSSETMQFVDSGPEDLSTAIWYGPVYSRAVYPEPAAAYDDPESYVELAAHDPVRSHGEEVDRASVDAADAAAELTAPPAAAPPETPIAGSDADQTREIEIAL